MAKSCLYFNVFHCGRQSRYSCIVVDAKFEISPKRWCYVMQDLHGHNLFSMIWIALQIHEFEPIIHSTSLADSGRMMRPDPIKCREFLAWADGPSKGFRNYKNIYKLDHGRIQSYSTLNDIIQKGISDTSTLLAVAHKRHWKSETLDHGCFTPFRDHPRMFHPFVKYFFTPMDDSTLWWFTPP